MNRLIHKKAKFSLGNRVIVTPNNKNIYTINKVYFLSDEQGYAYHIHSKNVGRIVHEQFLSLDDLTKMLKKYYET